MHPRAISYFAALLLVCCALSLEAKLAVVDLDAPAHALPRSAAPEADERHSGANTLAFVPLVSARSRMLNNNITITQSRLVLSSLDQLGLLQKLLGVVDLAPKLGANTMAQGTAKQEAASCDLAHTETLSGGASGGHGECVHHRRGYLVDLTAAKRHKAVAVGADLALIDLGDGTTLGFGWRYPLAYWNQLRDDDRKALKCAVNQAIGQFFYC